MKPAETRKPTPYPDINNLLGFWEEGVKNIVGENLVGLYLTGSLTYEDFLSDRSDIDLLAVVRKPLSETELESVKQLHQEIEQRYPVWAKRIECSYLPINLINEVLPPKTPRPWWGFGTFYPDAPYGNEWIINQYFLYRYGIALIGPSFKTLVKSIDVGEVQKASARDLFKEWEPKINDPEWLADSHNRSYLILNLCRILFTVMQGELGSKKAAAIWVKETYPQWKNLIEEAEGWQYGKEIKRNEETIAFIKFAVERVNDKNLNFLGVHD